MPHNSATTLISEPPYLTGLNFIVTVHRMRAPGMTWFRLPLFVWTHYATSLILVIATPVLAMTLTLVAVERVFRVGIFDPALGGDPILFQHLFWFYAHPAVYIMILPAMGVVGELVTCFSRQDIYGYEFVAFASLGVAFYGFPVWGYRGYLGMPRRYYTYPEEFQVLNVLPSAGASIHGVGYVLP